MKSAKDLKTKISSSLLYYRKTTKDNYTLVYKVDIISEESRIHETYYIDSQTGIVIDSFDNIYASTGTVATVYNGSKSVKTTWRGWPYSYYYLKNPNTSTIIETRNSSFDDDFPTCDPWGFSNMDKVHDSNNIWTLDSKENAASTHWAVSEAYNVYQTYFGRTYGTFTSSGNEIRVENNYYRRKINEYSGEDEYHGPFWTGIGYDDDYIHAGSELGLTNGFEGSLDVMGHEFTHGVIYRSRLANPSTYSEARALMESYCDIFGEVIEYYTLGSTDWCVGTNFRSAFRRSFSNPTTYKLYNVYVSVNANCEPTVTPTTSVSNYPVMYEGVNWSTNDHPYINLMVQNRWFYLLAKGGTENEVTVSPIGIEKAAKIVYNSMVDDYDATWTYEDARTSTIIKAEDLYGECSTEYQQVMNAWAAVNVGDPAPDPCNVPMNVYINGPEFIEEGSCDTWYANVSGGTGSYIYNWYLDNIWQSSSSSYYDCFYDEGFYDIRLSVISGSQTESEWLYLYVTQGEDPPPPMEQPQEEVIVSTFPNPTTDYFTVRIEGKEKSIREIVDEKYYIYVTDGQGRIFEKKAYYGGDVSFNTSRFINGLYTVVIVDNNRKIIKTKQVLISK